MITEFVDPRKIAEAVYNTKDGNISCYRLNEVFVRIEDLSEVGQMGFLYTNNGKALISCLNGRYNFSQKALSEHNKICDNNNSYDNGCTILEDEVCVLTRLWSNNYFHFMFDVLDKLLIAEEMGFRGKYMLFKDEHAEEILSLIKMVSNDRIIWVDRRQNGLVFFAKKMFEPEGFTHYTRKGLLYLEKMSKKITERFSENDLRGYPKYVFVKRIGRRKLLNCEDVLSKHGFYTLIPEEHSIIEEIKYFYCADVIVCPHGAALTNIIFMRSGTAFLELFPASFINVLCYYLADHKKIHYNMLVERNLEYKEIDIDQSRDYCIDEALMEKSLDDIFNIQKIENENKKLPTLRKEVSRANDCVRELNTQKQKLDSKIIRLYKKLEVKNDKFTTALEQFGCERLSMKVESDKLHEELGRLSSENEIKTKRLEQMSDEKEKFNLAEKSYKEEIKTLHAEKDKLHEELGRLSSENEIKTKHLEQMSREKEVLNSALLETDAKLSRERYALFAANRKEDSLSADISLLKEEIAQLEKEKSLVSSELDKTRQELKNERDAFTASAQRAELLNNKIIEMQSTRSWRWTRIFRKNKKDEEI